MAPRGLKGALNAPLYAERHQSGRPTGPIYAHIYTNIYLYISHKNIATLNFLGEPLYSVEYRTRILKKNNEYDVNNRFRVYFISKFALMKSYSKHICIHKVSWNKYIYV